MTCAEAVELIPAHALDALDGDEAAILTDHLATCPTCQTELVAFQEVSCHFPLGAPAAEPSPALRSRLLSAAAASARETRPLRPSWWTILWAPFVRYSPAVAVVALVIAVGALLRVSGNQSDLDQQRAANRALTEQLIARDQQLGELLAPGLEVRDLRADAVAPLGRGALFVNRQSTSAVLSAVDLPPLPPDRVYQLWLIRDGQRTSGGHFTVDAEGRGRLSINAPLPLGSYQAVGVTIEPLGGSPGPTGARVLAGSL